MTKSFLAPQAAETKNTTPKAPSLKQRQGLWQVAIQQSCKLEPSALPCAFAGAAARSRRQDSPCKSPATRLRSLAKTVGLMDAQRAGGWKSWVILLKRAPQKSGADDVPKKAPSKSGTFQAPACTWLPRGTGPLWP